MEIEKKIIESILILAAAFACVYLGTAAASALLDAGYLMLSNICLMSGWLLAAGLFLLLW